MPFRAPLAYGAGMRARVRFALCVILLAAAAAVAPGILRSRFVADRRAAHSVKQAAAHLAAREIDQARGALHEALRVRPDHAQARQKLAELELKAGNWELAFLDLETLTELHPEDPNGWIGLAGLMGRAGLLGAPEAALDKALFAAPKRADGRLLRADLRFRAGRYFGARQDAQAALAEAPADAAAWAMLVRSAARSQDTKAGIETVQRGLAATGRDPALVRIHAWLLAEDGRVREGALPLEESVRAISADGAAARLEMERIRARSGARAAAAKDLDALLVQRPADDEGVALRAILDATHCLIDVALARLDHAPPQRTVRELRERIQSARAERLVLASLLTEWTGRELGPAPLPPARIRAEAQTGRGRLSALAREHWPGRLAQARQALEIQMRQQNWAAAERIADSTRTAFPESEFGPFLAGIVALGRGDTEGAEKHLLTSLQRSPRSPVITGALAKTWSRRKDAAFAGQELMRLAERDGGFAFARYIAASAYMDARDPVQAEAAIRRGLQLQPDSPVAVLHLAEFNQELDRPADALAALQEGLRRFPRDVDVEGQLAQVSLALGRTDDAIHLYEDILARRPDLDL